MRKSRVGNIFLAERKSYGNQDMKVSLIDADGWREVFGPNSLGEGNGTASIWSLYYNVSWLRRCVDLRGDSLSAVPWEVVKLGADKNEDPLYDGQGMPPDDLKFMRGFSTKLSKIEKAVLLSGGAYLFKKFTNNRLERLKWWDPRTTKPHYDKFGMMTGYERDVNGKTIGKLAEEVVAVFATDDPGTEVGPGVPLALAAMVHARALGGSSGFAAEHLENGALLHTFLGVKGGAMLTPEQRSDAEDTWVSKLTGWRKKKKVHVINADAVSPFKIGEGLADITNRDLTDHERESICTDFGVPFSMAAMTRSDGVAALSDREAFLVDTIVPAAERVEEQLNDQLFVELGYEFRFRPERHEVMQKVELAKADKLIGLVTADIYDVDEARFEMGKDAREGGSAREEADKAAELRTWKRYVKKHGRNGRDFKLNHIEVWEAAIIKDRLNDGQEIDDAMRLP